MRPLVDRFTRNRLFILLLAAAAASFGATSASASPVPGLGPPVFEVNGTPLAVSCDAASVPIVCGSDEIQGNGFAMALSFVMNPDPTITGAFTLNNLSATTQTFTVTMTLGIAPVGPALAITGSIGDGTLTDLNGNGATLTDAGTSIYAAQIDGASVRTLLDPPQSYTAAPGVGVPGTATIPAVSFGPEGLAQAANLSIGIRTEFTLTAGDSIFFPESFAVVPVPEPGTLLLLGGGVVGLVSYRRRACG